MGSNKVVVTVSPKYQVIIPKHVREKIRLKKGEKMKISIHKKGLFLERVLPVEKLIGKYPRLNRDPSIRTLRKEADERLDRD